MGKLPVECTSFLQQWVEGSFQTEEGSILPYFLLSYDLWSQYTRQEYFSVLVNRDSGLAR